MAKNDKTSEKKLSNFYCSECDQMIKIEDTGKDIECPTCGNILEWQSDAGDYRGVSNEKTRVEIISGPVRHETLPYFLLERIKRFKQVLAEVEMTTLEEAVDNFSRDAHPEREVEIWERIAGLYKEETDKKPGMTLSERRKLFTLFLRTSMMGGD